MVFTEAVFFAIVLALFGSVCLGGWWVLAPLERRANRIALLGACASRLRTRVLGIATRCPTRGGLRNPLRRYAWDMTRGMQLGALGLILAPLLFAFFLRDRHQLDGFDDHASDSNQVVAAILRGEQLAPPPPLPPQVFTTAEVEQIRPQIRFASRQWDKLDAEFAQRLLQIFKLMEQRHGYHMVLIEGYRSPERQAMLASMGPHVTNAGAYQSYHQVGLGADCAFYRNGRLVISEKDPWAMRGYTLYGELAREFGLTWGGMWKMLDLGHVELRRPDVLRRARHAAVTAQK